MSMSSIQQPVHILRKDAIHLWPETLLSIVLLLALAWAIPQSWTPDANVPLLTLGFYALEALIIISWLILTSRLVHDEELVGDRQFWITRPYTWYSLLASKVLYLLLFVGLPLILVQAWLLHHAHLYPTAVIPGLIKNFLQLALICLLPLLAIAAVTGTFIRYISSVLGSLVYILVILIFALSVCGFAYWMNTFGAPNLNYVLAVVFILFPVAAILIQYALRKTMIARIVLVATPIVFLLVAIAAPRNLLTAERYPNTAVGNATFAPELLPPPSAAAVNITRHKVTLVIPVTAAFDGLSEKPFMDVQRYKLTLDGEGVHYTSDWEVTSSRFTPGPGGAVIPVTVPEEIFTQVHLKPIALHITLGVQTLRLGKPYIVTVTEQTFPIQNHGTCNAISKSGTLDCRFPFGNPDLTAIEATVHDGDCTTPGTRSGPAQGVISPALLPLGFNPVSVEKVQLTVGRTPVSICPGTPITLTRAEKGAYGRLTVDIPAITLDPYALRIPTKQPTSTPQPEPIEGSPQP